jgi:EAL domain-containing protein (putative c-di-GMP-specific phosphodiesterase class I)
VKRTVAALEANALPPSCLRLEITEQVLVDELLAASETLRDLRAHGIGLAIDDFGAGASSLASLRAVDAEVLKLDRSFVRELGSDEDGPVVVGAITAMAHALGLQVIAEGVETIEQMRAAAAAGCDRAQGYLFARPMPPEDLAGWIANWEDRAAELVSALAPTVPAPLSAD